MSNVKPTAVKFEEMGGFSAVKEAFLASDKYPYTKSVVLERIRDSVHGLGARGVLAAVPRNRQEGFQFMTFGGVCHASSRRDEDEFKRTNQVVMFTFPLTGTYCSKTAAKTIRYDQKFLDEYYTWLTTESPAKGVFLEPWNGEFLSINLAMPASLVLFACIMSRYLVESYHSSLIIEKAREQGFSWWECVLFTQLTTNNFVGDNKHYWHWQHSGAGAHNVSPITYLENLGPLIKGELVPCNEEHRGALPWNNQSSAACGVWAMFNNGFDLFDYNITDKWQTLKEAHMKKLGCSKVPDKWGGSYWKPSPATSKLTNNEVIDILLKGIREFLDTNRGE